MENGEIDLVLSFGYWIQRRRKAMDMTRPELARRVGCAVVTIKKIEQDERKPSRQMALLLAEHLAIQEAVREDFLEMARGKYVPDARLSKGTLGIPPSLQFGAQLSKNRDAHFVERQPELARLKAWLAQASAGSGRPGFILGDAGSGKTTLAAEFARQAQEIYPDLLVAGGQCNALTGAGDPYRPIRDILGMLTGDFETNWLVDELNHEQILRLWSAIPEIIQAVTETGPDLVDVLLRVSPFVRRVAPYLIGPADWLDRFRALDRAEQPRNANFEQNQVLEEVTRVFRSVAAHHPLLLVLDDLQWVDNASLNLLFHLGRRLAGSRILLLGVLRLGEAASKRKVDHLESGELNPLESLVLELTRQYGNIQIDLNRASSAEGKAFINALIDREPNLLGDAFREDLFRQTQGQPLFTVEILRNMQTSGKLVLDSSGRWVESPVSSPGAMPARVEAVIEQRLGRLSPRQLKLLGAASVAGEVFTAEVVAVILGRDLRPVLEGLAHELGQSQRLVQELGEFQVGAVRLNRFRFSHLLFQEFLYNQLSPGERFRWHRYAAQALEKIWFEASGKHAQALNQGTEIPLSETTELASPDYIDSFGPQLAYHFWQGEDWQKAAIYALQMGKQARKRYAMREAMAYYEKALLALARQTDSPDEFTFEALLGWEEAAFKFKPYEEQLVQLARAEAIARRMQNKPHLIRVLHWTANVYLEKGFWTRAGPALTECLALADELSDARLSVRPIFFMALMTSFADPPGSLAWLERALNLAQEYGDLHIEAIAFATKGQVLAQLGEFTESRQAIERARQVSGRLGSPITESDVDLLGAWACLAMGDVEHGLALGQRSVQQAIAVDNMDCLCSGLACVGYGNLELRRMSDAVSAFEQGIERSEISGAMIPKLNGQAGLAMAQFSNGRLEAITDLENVIRDMHRVENEVGAANANYLLGRCFLQLRAFDRAEICLNEALDYYRHSKMKPFLARTSLSLSELFEKQGRHSDALKAKQEAEILFSSISAL